VDDNNIIARNLSILGISLGSPELTSTYSGVPFHLFGCLKEMGVLKAVVDGLVVKPIDMFRGAMDFRRSISARRPKRNAIWRYRPMGQKILSRRLDLIRKESPAHNTLLQIGVGPKPNDEVKLVAHVEIAVKTAFETEIYAKQYGFNGHSQSAVKDAIKGERDFLERCDLVWTNSEWTAQGLIQQGVDTKKLFIHPPAACIDDPGCVQRDWEMMNILFIGVDWHRKGGNLLVEAFKKFRQINKNAKLSIVGCAPEIEEDGIDVVGYLDKNNQKDNARLKNLFQNATIFCMPSYWDSTGLVYMEAALWGIPVIMLRGQGRETIFPNSTAIHLDTPCAKTLCEIFLDLNKNPEKMAKMGQSGRKLVLENYTWKIVSQRLLRRLNDLF
jgi:glycosyltransferase involved in cell wall biosynthesis